MMRHGENDYGLGKRRDGDCERGSSHAIAGA
jgi:hypothetical protein